MRTPDGVINGCSAEGISLNLPPWPYDPDDPNRFRAPEWWDRDQLRWRVDDDLRRRVAGPTEPGFRSKPWRERDEIEVGAVVAQRKRVAWRKVGVLICEWIADPRRKATQAQLKEVLEKYSRCDIHTVQGLMEALIDADYHEAETEIINRYQQEQDRVSHDPDRTPKERWDDQAEVLAEREHALEVLMHLRDEMKREMSRRVGEASR